MQRHSDAIQKIWCPFLGQQSDSAKPVGLLNEKRLMLSILNYVRLNYNVE